MTDKFFPSKFTLSPQDLVDAFQTVEEEDSPNNPGWVKVGSLLSALARFRLALSITVPAEWAARPEGFLKEGGSPEELVEWNRPEVLRLFETKLNVYERVFLLLEPGHSSTKYGKYVPIAILCVIILSVASWVSSSMKGWNTPPTGCVPTLEVGSCAPQPYYFFGVIELVCLFFFCAEYGIRLLTCHSVRFLTFRSSAVARLIMYDDPVKPATLKSNVYAFFTSLQYIIDLLAILPQLISYALPTGAEAGGYDVVQILRMFRVFRVFKVASYNETFVLFTRVLVTSLSSLILIFICVVIGLVLFGSMMWYLESGKWYPKGHPTLEKLGQTAEGAYVRIDYTPFGFNLSPFTSIPASFWYVIATMTTVGYGDVVPVTDPGKTVGTVCMLSGILSMALPIGVIGSNFAAELTRINLRKERYAKMQKKLQQSEPIDNRNISLPQVPVSDAAVGHLEQLRVLLGVLGREKPRLNQFADQFVVEANSLMAANKVDGHAIDQFITSSFSALSIIFATDSGEVSKQSAEARGLILKVTTAILARVGN